MKLSAEEIQAKLAEVRRSYLASLLDKQEAISTKWAQLDAQWDDATYQSLYIIIHSLAGSAETFGLSQVTKDARTVVDLFKHHADAHPFAVKVRQRLDAQINQLLASMRAGPTQISAE